MISAKRCLAEETRSLPLAEHDFGEWTATVSPTCTEPGSKNRACSVCGHTETAEIPAVGHKYVLVEERPATCAENGKKIFECSVCHDIKEEITEDKLNHDFGDAAPCAEDVTCIRCGEKRQPLPHSHATREIEPTCTESGYIEEYCTECGKIFAKIENAEPSGHDFCEWRLVKAPTCTEPGVQTRVCERCGERVNEVVEATGHSVVYVPAKAADCTHDGYEAYAYCSVCGEEIIPKVAIAAAGHDFGEWETETAATCEEEGTEARSCKSCGTVEKRVVPATGHKWITLVEVSATESAEGVIIYMCSVCEATRQETIPKIEHVHDYDYVSIYGVGVACSCGRVNANEGNVIIDSSNTVSGICEGSGNVIVVPNTAYAVKWESVFCRNLQVEYIYFGENITLIADPCAFEGCENLKAIYVSTECSIPVVPEFWPDMEIIRVDYNS